MEQKRNVPECSKERNKNMDKKKMIIFLVIAVVIVAIIIGVICFFAFGNKNSNENPVNKISKLYENLKAKETYSFTAILDDNNKELYAKGNNAAYTESVYDGNVSKYVIKDGNSYLIVDEANEYYTYANNETDLNKVEKILANLSGLEFTTGEEKVNNKKYQYMEYGQATDFTMMSSAQIASSGDVKTRFYFSGDKLAYIKTIVGEKEELLKVDISDKVNSSLFEIPANYEEK